MDAFEDRSCVMCVSSVCDALYVPLGIQSYGTKGFDFSPDNEASINLGKDKRLYPVAVPSTYKQFGPRIIKTKCELAAQVAKKGYAVDLVQCDDDLAVTLSLERPAGLFSQLLSISVILIEFSVHDGMYVAIRGMERLLAVRAQVVDGETDVTQCCISLSARAWGATSWLMRMQKIPTRPSELVQVLRASGPRCLMVSRLCSNFEVVEPFEPFEPFV
jgi:hypothetical protein